MKRIIGIFTFGSVLWAALLFLVFPGIFILCLSPYVVTIMAAQDKVGFETHIWLISIGSLMILGGLGIIAVCYKLCRVNKLER